MRTECILKPPRIYNIDPITIIGGEYSFNEKRLYVRASSKCNDFLSIVERWILDLQNPKNLSYNYKGSLIIEETCITENIFPTSISQINEGINFVDIEFSFDFMELTQFDNSNNEEKSIPVELEDYLSFNKTLAVEWDLEFKTLAVEWDLEFKTLLEEEKQIV